MERHSYKMVPIDTLSAKGYLNQGFLKKNSWLFFEKTDVFSKKTQLSFVLVNLTISVAFYGKYATIWGKKFHFQKHGQKSFNVNAIGTHQIRKNVPFERKIFPPYFMKTVENN